MARKPRYGRVTDNVSFRPRPDNETAIKVIVKETGLTRAEVADEVFTLGLPVFLRRKPEIKEALKEAAA